MAGPAKTTVVNKSIRVAEGSALARLTEGLPFTETVHKMAELFETALAENWGPPPVIDRRDFYAYEGDVERVDARLQRMAQELPAEGARLRAEIEQQQQFVIGHDDRTTQVVSRDELLRIAAEQAPSGLVPVGLDEAEDDDQTTVGGLTINPDDPVYGRFVQEPALTGSMELDDDEDLSYLV